MIVQSLGDGRWLAVVRTGKSAFRIYRDTEQEAARCAEFFLPIESPVNSSTANHDATLTALSAEGI